MRILLFLVLAAALQAQITTSTNPVTTISPLPYIESVAIEPTTLTFSCGIIVDMKTGKVTLPKGMKLDRASAEFWGTVGSMFSRENGTWTLLETLTEAKRENAALGSFMEATQGADFLAKEGRMLDLYIQRARGVKP